MDNGSDLKTLYQSHRGHYTTMSTNWVELIFITTNWTVKQKSRITWTVSRDSYVFLVEFHVCLLFAEYSSSAELWEADILMNRLISLTGLVGKRGYLLIILSFINSFNVNTWSWINTWSRRERPENGEIRQCKCKTM